jgi:hypothetical protein
MEDLSTHDTWSPKVLITTSAKATKATYEFCDELLGVFPGSQFVRRKKRKEIDLGRIASWAANRNYGHIITVNEDMKKPSGCNVPYPMVAHIFWQMPSRWSASHPDPLRISDYLPSN